MLRHAVGRLIKAFPRQFRLQLIRYDEELGAYVEAHNYLAELLSLRWPLGAEEPVEFSAEELLLCCDSRQHAVAMRSHLLQELSRSGLGLLFLLDDLRDPYLETLRPGEISEVFADWLRIVAGSSGAICSSEGLADELRACLEESSLTKNRFRILVAQDWLSDRRADEKRSDAMRQLIDRIIQFWTESGNHPEDRGLPDASFMGEADLLK